MKLFKFAILVVVVLSFGVSYAHKGRTDASGGHRDVNNVSGLGYYHYHCDGYQPHLHGDDGSCQYSYNENEEKLTRRHDNHFEQKKRQASEREAKLINWAERFADYKKEDVTIEPEKINWAERFARLRNYVSTEHGDLIPSYSGTAFTPSEKSIKQREIDQKKISKLKGEIDWAKRFEFLQSPDKGNKRVLNWLKDHIAYVIPLFIIVIITLILILRQFKKRKGKITDEPSRHSAKIDLYESQIKQQLTMIEAEPLQPKEDGRQQSLLSKIFSSVFAVVICIVGIAFAIISMSVSKVLSNKYPIIGYSIIAIIVMVLIACYIYSKTKKNNVKHSDPISEQDVSPKLEVINCKVGVKAKSIEKDSSNLYNNENTTMDTKIQKRKYIISTILISIGVILVLLVYSVQNRYIKLNDRYFLDTWKGETHRITGRERF